MDRLTTRQFQALELACRDFSNGEIAYALGIRPQTVKQHLTLAYAKLGVDGRAGACRRFGAAPQRRADARGRIDGVAALRAEQV